VAPPRRRLLWAVLTVIGVVGACAFPAALLAGLLVRSNSGADRPSAAVDSVMHGMERPGPADPAEVATELGPYLTVEHYSELRGRLLNLRSQLLDNWAVLERGEVAENGTADDRATVTVEYRVSATLPGRSSPTTTEFHRWTFQTVKLGRFGDGGWKVDAVDIPDICVTYLHCAGPGRVGEQ
jgi:hypothetical protein